LTVDLWNKHRDQVSAACKQAVKSMIQGQAGGAAASAEGTRPASASATKQAHASGGAAHYFEQLQLVRPQP